MAGINYQGVETMEQSVIKHEEKARVIGDENSGFEDLIFIPFTDSIKLTKAVNMNPWVPNCGVDFLPLLHTQNLDRVNGVW